MDKEDKQLPQKGASSPSPSDDQVIFEWNLMRILGPYFVLDNKKQPQVKDAQEFLSFITDSEKNKKELLVTIAPNSLWGYPGPGAAHTFFHLIEKHFEEGFPIPRSMSISSRRGVLRALGYKKAGSSGIEQVMKNLNQLRQTFIHTPRYDKQTGKWIDRPFTLLQDLVLAGNKNTITYCSWELDKDVHENINMFYGLRVFYHRIANRPLLQQLLFLNLFMWLTIAYRAKNGKKKDLSTYTANGLFYHKDYQALISEWFPNLKIKGYRSHIIYNQLGPHLDALSQRKKITQQTDPDEDYLLTKWDIKENKDGTGFTLYFYPGKAFFDDFIHIQTLQRGAQGRLSLQESEQQSQPDKEQKTLLEYFYNHLYPTDNVSKLTDLINENEKKFAEDILKKLTLEEAKGFVDYALEKIANTKYTPAMFTGLRGHLIGYLSVKNDIVKKRNEGLQNAYAVFRIQAASSLRVVISPELVSKFEQEAEKEVLEGEYPKYNHRELIRVRVDRKILDHYGTPGFKQWAAVFTKNPNYTAEDFIRSVKK